MAKKRHQHLVPRTYLTQFANGKLIRMYLRSGDTGEIGIGDAAVRYDFYTDQLAKGGGLPPDHVETFLDEHVEREAAAALKSLVGGAWPPSTDEKAALTRFVAFQMVRGADFRSLNEQMSESLGPLTFAHEVVSRWLDDIGLENAVDADVRAVFEHARSRAPREMRRIDDPRSTIRTMLRTAAWLEPRLADRAWLLARGANGGLLTSDSPVVLGYPTGRPEGFRGILPPDADVLLPLSPTSLLVITPTPSLGPATLTGDLVKLVNTEQARSCDAAVFCHPDQRLPSDMTLLRKRPAVLPTPTYSVKLQEPARPTEPRRYDEVADPVIDQLIRNLGGKDEVP